MLSSLLFIIVTYYFGVEQNTMSKYFMEKLDRCLIFGREKIKKAGYNKVKQPLYFGGLNVLSAIMERESVIRFGN